MMRVVCKWWLWWVSAVGWYGCDGDDDDEMMMMAVVLWPQQVVIENPKLGTLLDQKSPNTIVDQTLDDPQKALKNKGIVNSGCSRHMTGNKAYLVEYQTIMWPVMLNIVKSSEAKNGDVKPNGDTGPKTSEEPKDHTNTVNTVSTPISTASPSNVFSAGGPDLNNNDQDDSQIPTLEDIYDNPSDEIFTNAS
ncbi:hypothetical protein Tco_1195439 [Tanacetum coccineum]